jgi:hypothetical protein
MTDKVSGKVGHGLMGIGEDYYRLPWSLLTYNARLDGYEIDIGECSSGERAKIQRP